VQLVKLRTVIDAAALLLQIAAEAVILTLPFHNPTAYRR
jgi:hypothetical protein